METNDIFQVRSNNFNFFIFNSRKSFRIEIKEEAGKWEL